MYDDDGNFKTGLPWIDCALGLSAWEFVAVCALCAVIVWALYGVVVLVGWVF